MPRPSPLTTVNEGLVTDTDPGAERPIRKSNKALQFEYPSLFITRTKARKVLAGRPVDGVKETCENRKAPF